MTTTKCEFCGRNVKREFPILRANRAGRSANFCSPCMNAIDDGFIRFPGGEGATFEPWFVEANLNPLTGNWNDRPVAPAVRS